VDTFATVMVWSFVAVTVLTGVPLGIAALMGKARGPRDDDDLQ